MSQLDKLVTRLCPQGVQFVTLEEIAATIPGLSGKSKADFSGGNARYVSYKNAFANLAVDQELPDYVHIKPGERQNRLQLGDVVFTGSSESLDEVGMSSVVLAEPTESLYLNSFCFVVRFTDPEILDPDFCKHLFRSTAIRKQICASASGVTRINISKARFMKTRIPIPPLDVQRNIATMLNLFTDLAVELDSELAARRKQYEYYRHLLLGFISHQQSFLIGDIVEGISSGRNKIRSESGMYPVYGSTGPIGFTDQFGYSGDAILVARVGANAGRVNMVSGEYDVSDNTLVVRPRVEWDQRFAFHQLTHMNLNQYAVGGGQPLVTGRLLKNLQVVLPPLSEQKRIASILDSFDTIVNSPNIGLPAEIEARRKQYEHYRDRLLTFEEVMS